MGASNPRSGLFGKIAGIQLIIFTFLGNQIIMAAAFNNPALFQNNNTVAVAHRGKPVGNDKCGTAIHQAIHALLYQRFRACINGTGGFIQNQYRRVSNGCTGNGQQLTLPLGQVGTVALEYRLITIG